MRADLCWLATLVAAHDSHEFGLTRRFPGQLLVLVDGAVGAGGGAVTIGLVGGSTRLYAGHWRDLIRGALGRRVLGAVARKVVAQNVLGRAMRWMRF